MADNDKKFNVTMKFPEASASRHWQATTVEASNFGLAANRAWGEIKTRQGIKGKRLKTVTITITMEENYES